MHVTDRHMPSEDLQAFPLCASPSVSGSEGCHHVTLREIMIDVVIIYAVCTTIYISVVSFDDSLLRAQRLHTSHHRHHQAYLVHWVSTAI